MNSKNPNAPVSLLRLLSLQAERIIGYLDEVETVLVRCAVVESLKTPHVQFGYDLRLDAIRIPRKVIPYDEETAKAAAEQLERLREYIPPSPRERDEEHRKGPKGERHEFRQAGPVRSPPQPLRQVLRPRRAPPLRLAIITGNPGSGKTEAIRYEIRLAARASRMALRNARLLPEEAVLPAYIKSAALADALADTEALDRIIAQFGEGDRPSSITAADWRTALRTAAALLKAIEIAYPTAQISSVTESLWHALTQTGQEPALAFVALDGWDETAEKQRMLLKDSLRPYARALRSRLIVASRLLHWVRSENPLFDPAGADSRSARELTLCEFDPKNVKDFITRFFAMPQMVEKPGAVLPSARRAMGERLIKELATAHHLTTVTPNALMATFLCNIYWVDQISGKNGLPATRGELFEGVLKQMLGKWRFLRTGAEVAEAQGNWSDIEAKYADLFDLLAGIAAFTFPYDMVLGTALHGFLHRGSEDAEYQGYITRLDSAHPLKKYIESLDRPIIREFCDDAILIEVRGEKGNGFSFPHKQILEYLVARSLAKRINPPKDAQNRPLGKSNWNKMRDEIDARAWDPDYREVMVFLAGLLEDPLPLLDLLANEQTDDVIHTRTTLAACCLPEITQRVHGALRGLFNAITCQILEGPRISPHFKFALAGVAVVGGRYKGRSLLDHIADKLSSATRIDDVSVSHLIDMLGPLAATQQISAQLLRLLQAPFDGDPDSDESAREHLAEVISALGDMVVTPEFLSGLQDLLVCGNPNARRAAAKAIGQLGAVVATPHIIDVLKGKLLVKHPSSENAAAAEALGRLGETIEIKGILDQFLDVLADGRSSELHWAIPEAFSLLRDDVTPVILMRLTEMLKHQEFGVYSGAARVIQKIGRAAATPDILAELLRMLSDEHRTYSRHYAADAIGGLGDLATTSEILARFSDLLASESAGRPDIRWSVARAVGHLGVKALSAPILAGLQIVLSAQTWDYDSIGQMIRGLGTAAATPEILDCLAARLRDSKFAAARTIGSFGSVAATPEILAGLTELLVDQYWVIRHHSLDAVGELGPKAASPEIVSLVEDLLSDSDAYVRASAIHAAVRLDNAALTSKVHALLDTLLTDKEHLVRKAAVETIYLLRSCPSHGVLTHDFVEPGIRQCAQKWSHLRVFKRGERYEASQLAMLTQWPRPITHPT